MKSQLEEVQYRFRKDDVEHLKYIETDKELIKEFLRERIRTTFQECTAPSDENVLEVDVKDWGRSRRGAMRNHSRPGAKWSAPWKIIGCMCVSIWVSYAPSIVGCSK